MLSLQSPTAAAAACAQAAQHLRAGGVLVAPTETFYGLVARADVPEAVAQVLACKGRAPDKPLPLVVADEAMAEAVAELDAPMRQLMRRFWPGPLTLVLPARPAAVEAVRCPPAVKAVTWAPAVKAADDTLALRVPAHAWLRALCAAVGAPLTATSANCAGAPAVRTVAAVRLQPGADVLYVDGGATPGGAPSTLVVQRGAALHCLRHGAVAFADVLAHWRP